MTQIYLRSDTHGWRLRLSTTAERHTGVLNLGPDGLGWMDPGHSFQALATHSGRVSSASLGSPSETETVWTHPDPQHQNLPLPRSPEESEHRAVCEVLLHIRTWRKPLILRRVHPPSEAWAYLYRLYLHSRPVVAIHGGKARERPRAVIRSNNICPQPALRAQSPTPPTFRALPWDRFNWTPVTPPSVEFIVYQVRTFHTVSLSQTFHPKNR